MSILEKLQDIKDDFRLIKEDLALMIGTRKALLKENEYLKGRLTSQMNKHIIIDVLVDTFNKRKIRLPKQIRNELVQEGYADKININLCERALIDSLIVLITNKRVKIPEHIRTLINDYQGVK